MSLFEGLFKQPKKLVLSDVKKMEYLFNLVVPALVHTASYEQFVTTMFVLGRAHDSGNPDYSAKTRLDATNGGKSTFSFREISESEVCLYMEDSGRIISLEFHGDKYTATCRSMDGKFKPYVIADIKTFIEILEKSPWYLQNKH